MKNAQIESLLKKGVARIIDKSHLRSTLYLCNKLIVIFFFLLLPSLANADIAGPVLTKYQACMEKDGRSSNRLQIFINGKGSDTLYFFKQDKRLYYIVPLFPYTKKTQSGTSTYAASLFLYTYSCEDKKAELLSTKNLKELITQNNVFTPTLPISRSEIKEFNYGEVLQITTSEVLFEIGITQTGIRGAYSMNLKNKKFDNQIYIGADWTLKNYKNFNGIYDIEGNWEGTDVYYKGKRVYHFATCKGWGTEQQTDIDDFCGGSINVLSSGSDGLVFSLSYNYPGAPLENGEYILKLDSSIKKLK